MNSPADQEIRRRLASYLAGQLTLGEFHRWLMSMLWTIDRQDDALTFHRASKIALYMAEFGLGHRTETELRGLLGPFLLAPQS